jgi:dUTP pyrophosphatase
MQHSHPNSPVVKVKATSAHGADALPRKATAGSAGYDLFAAIQDPITLEPGESSVVSTGFAMVLPEAYEAQIRPRSGLAAKHGITVLNTPGTIDSDYRGEVKAILINHSRQSFTVRPLDRIAQMVISYVPPLILETVPEDIDLEHSPRGTGGLGSTGVSESLGIR